MTENIPWYSLKKDFISRLSQTKQHIVALLVILILPFILFDKVTVGGEKIIGPDSIQWRAAAESVYETGSQNEEWSLWAPNMFSGMPAYTFVGKKAIPHIDTLFRDVFRAIYPVAFYWILLIGIYLFFILQKIRPLSSLLGAVCIGFTTYIPIILGAGHNTKFIALTFIPWVLVGYWMLTRSDKKWLSFALFAIALTLEFRANHPQVTYYFFVLLGLWWLFDTGHAFRNKTFKKWAGITGLLLLAGLLGFLGACQQYWELKEYTPYSTRGGSELVTQNSDGLNMTYAFRWSQGRGELLTLVIPGLYGGSSSKAYWGPKPMTSGPHYLGVVAFLLFLFGVFYSTNKLKYLFLGVGILTLLFSLGYHFRTFNQFFFNYMPYFNKFRAPEMWLIVTIFCFSVVAVYGLEQFIIIAKEKSNSMIPLIAPLGIALGLGVLFYFGSNMLLSYEKPGQIRKLVLLSAAQNNVSPENQKLQSKVASIVNTTLIPPRKDMAQDDTTRYLILVLIVTALIIAFHGRYLSYSYFLTGLIIITCYDYISVDNRYINTKRLVPQEKKTALVIEQKKRPVDTFIQNHISSGNGWKYRTLPLSSNPFNNAVPSYFYPTIGGYSGAKLSIYQDFINRLLYTNQGTLNIDVLSMLNVKFVSSTYPLARPAFEKVYADSTGYLYRNNKVLPKTFFVDSVIYAYSPIHAFELLEHKVHLNTKKTAVIEQENPPQIKPDSTANIKITYYSPDLIKMTTRRSKPGFLVLSEIYYPPGWKLTMDGKSAKIYKTNYVLRGFYVPAGTHHFNMQFNPAAATWGKPIVRAANFLQWGLLIVGLTLLYRKRNGRPNDKIPKM